MVSDFMDRFRFNTENALDIFYIQNLKKKPIETFREYATRWRSKAVKTNTIWRTAKEEALSGLKDLFLEDEDMECHAIIEEEEEEGLSIQTVAKGDEIVREVENFDNKPKSNLDKIEAVNLGNTETIKETRISIHLSPTEKEEYIHFLKEYEDIFAWSYDNMIGLSTSIVAQKLPTNPMCPPVKQKLRKFKPNMSLKIKEDVTKQIKAKVQRVVKNPTWLANIVPVSKKDRKVRMDEEDAEKTTFIMPWVVYCYKMMSFGLKNVGATYMRALTTICHDMIHKEIEVYVDDVIIKSKSAANQIADLRKLFDRLRSRRGIELDPTKVKAVQELPPPKSKKDVMSFLGRLNYISQFIAQSTVICEPIFKMLRKDAETSWTDDCQKAFDKIKEYLSTAPVLVPPELGQPLLLYLFVLDGALGCVLGQHDDIGRKEQAIYYLSKKFTPYEPWYSLLNALAALRPGQPRS
ncbi:uncharacterized protein [Nicotiana sylvestris]|uniref:uncharacterized protein n=1 Tax=Nicotiana sylvestris TaxID=4096 RepID=UPI00388C4CD1